MCLAQCCTPMPGMEPGIEKGLNAYLLSAWTLILSCLKF